MTRRFILRRCKLSLSKLSLIAALLLPVALLSGCIPLSLHPLYTDQDVTADAALLGEWTAPDATAFWTITQDGPDQYHMDYTDEDHKQGRFQAHLVKLHGLLFMDVFPEETPFPQSYAYTGHLLPTHSLFRMIRLKPTPQFTMLSDDWLRGYLAKHPAAIEHEEVNGGMYLTASTHQLQQFLITHANTKGAFEPSVPWKKRASPVSQQPQSHHSMGARTKNVGGVG